ncbi:MAG: MarR family transcriptional regulator [Clostridiales bacterium]|nr:MarR family transcriptional regulator [Clostridiales bacterium]
MDGVYVAFNDILVKLFNDILNIEKNALINGEFVDISTNDMHIIEAVGLDEPMNMSAIAKKLSITIGSLTTAMNGLVKKGYVVRERSEEDRRVVFIRLTEKGVRAYHHHAKFHYEMIDYIVKNLNDEEKGVLIKSLIRMKKFFLDQKE